jgi:hypothetical protein
MTERITTALAQLDPDRDEHWTSSGLPAMDAMRALVGAEVTRAQVTAAAPDFTRSHPSLGGAPAGSPEVAPPDERPPADPVAEIRAAIREARAERTALSSEIGRAQERLAAIDQRLDTLTTQLERAVPQLTPAERYRQVAQRSTEERRRRVEAMNALAGGAGRSRIDQAMASRRGYGGQRPAYPLVGGSAK